jgi:hypothetical protein
MHFYRSIPSSTPFPLPYQPVKFRLISRIAPSKALYISKFHVRLFSQSTAQKQPFRRTTQYPVYPHDQWKLHVEPVRRFNSPRVVTSSFFAVFALVYFLWKFEHFLLDHPEEASDETRELYISLADRLGVKAAVPRLVYPVRAYFPAQRPRKEPSRVDILKLFDSSAKLLPKMLIWLAVPHTNVPSPFSPPIASSYLVTYVKDWPPKDLGASLFPYFASSFSHKDLLHLGVNGYIFHWLAPACITLIGPWRFAFSFVFGGFGAASLKCFIEQHLNRNTGLSSGNAARREVLARFRQSCWDHLPWPMSSLQELRKDDTAMDLDRWLAPSLGASSSLFCIGELTLLFMNFSL